MNLLDGSSSVDLALLALVLLLYGAAAGGALWLLVGRWLPRLSEGMSLSLGARFGLFVALLVRGWDPPEWLVVPALWIGVWIAFALISGTERSALALWPFKWVLVLTGGLAALALAAAALAALGWGAYLALRVPVIRYHAVGGCLGLWLGAVVMLAAQQRRLRFANDAVIRHRAGSELKVYAWQALTQLWTPVCAAAVGLLVAGVPWREGAEVPNSWMALSGMAVALLPVVLTRLTLRKRLGSRGLSGQLLAVGLIGLGAGALFMGGDWRWGGQGAIIAALLALALAPSRVSDTPATRLDGRRWWSLAVLASSVLLVAVDSTALNVALPMIATDIEGATTDDLAWVIAVYLLAFAGFLLTAGNLGDRFGRKRMFRGGLVVFGAASLIAAQSESVELLIGVRFAQGIGVALMSPTGLATLRAMFPVVQRGTAVGIWAAVNGLGVAIGPVIGGWFVEAFSWRWVFLVNVPVVVVALVFTRWLVPETTDPTKAGRLDPIGAVLSATGLGALLWGIIRARSAGWTSAEVATAGGAALLLLSLFVGRLAWQWRTHRPAMLPRGLFTREFVTATLAIGALYFALFGEAFALTFYLQDVRGYEPLRAGAALLPVAGGILITTLTASWLVKRVGVRWAMTGGLGVVMMALAAIFTASPGGDFWLPVGLALLGVGLGMGIVVAAGTSVIAKALPEAEAGAGAAFDTAVRQTFGALGVAVLASFMGWLYGNRVGDAAELGLPPEQTEAAGESVTHGVTLANRLMESAPNVGAALGELVRDAYVDAVHYGAVLIAVPVVAAAAGLVLLTLPGRAEIGEGHHAPRSPRRGHTQARHLRRATRLEGNPT